MRALTAEESRSVERRVFDETGATPGDLMARAGAAVAREVSERVPDGPIVVVAGPGNNGGDGWVAARLLHQAGRQVRVVSLVSPSELKGAAADAAAAANAAGVSWMVQATPEGADVGDATCIVDALLGTGTSLPLRDPLSRWVYAIDASAASVVSIDLPTGIDADTGMVPGAAVAADCTVALIALKRGLVMPPGSAYAGDVVLDTLDVPARLAEFAGAPEVWPADTYAALVKLPAHDTHKNERGRVLVVAGSGRFPGAAVLTARGAMRSGAGYVTLAVPDSVASLAQGHLLAATVVGLPQGRSRTLSSSAAEAALDLAHDYDAVVLGPGLTLSDGAVAAVRGIVARLNKPLVLDADALNALVDARELIEGRVAPTVLTPHPGELARLLGVRVSDIQADRLAAALELASGNCTVALKGAGTVVAQDGRLLVNTSGTPALATAGSGDVLAGLIGGLLAQGMQPFEATALGVYLHGRAGESAASELTPLCVTAEDLPNHLPKALADLLEMWRAPRWGEMRRT